MNSLKVKFLGLTGLILVVVVAGTTWYNLQTQRGLLESMAAEHARLIAETVRNSIMTDMASGRNDQVGHTLNRVSREPAIASLRIFDETGRVTFADKPADVGDLVATADLLAYRTGSFNFVDSSAAGEHYTSLLPFENGPTCHACHSKERQILGILSVKLSLDDLVEIQQRSRNATIIAAGILLLVLIVGITLVLLAYVDKPVRQLLAVLDQAEQGDITGNRALIGNSREMTLLANRFTTLARALNTAQREALRNKQPPDPSGDKTAQAEEVHRLKSSLAEQASAAAAADQRIAELTSQSAVKDARLTRAAERLQALIQAGLAINAEASIPELLDLLCQKATAALQGQIGYILILDEAAGCLRIGGAAGLPADFDRAAAIPFAAGGVSFRVIVGNRPVLVDHIDEFPEFARMSQFGYSRKSLVCAPISGQQQAIGSITIANPRNGSKYGSDDLELLVAMAAHVSVAMRLAGSGKAQSTT